MLKHFIYIMIGFENYYYFLNSTAVYVYQSIVSVRSFNAFTSNQVIAKIVCCMFDEVNCHVNAPTTPLTLLHHIETLIGFFLPSTASIEHRKSIFYYRGSNVLP